MAVYTWGMHPDAEPGLRECQGVYGPRFRQEAHQWLATVAQEAACGRSMNGGYNPAMPESLQYVTSEKLKEAMFAPEVFQGGGVAEFVKALFHMARTRNPPYEHWVTEKYFADIASSFDHTAKAFFIVDHVRRRVTFTEIVDLPGS